jgi:cystathionine beta-lyase
VCTSPSKAFNLAGLHCANIFVPDETVYARIDRAVNIHEVGEMNPFGVEALMAAYNESGQWLDELQQLVYNNYLYVCRFIREQLPLFSVTKEEGTYLAWVNVSASGLSTEEFCHRLAEQEKVLFNPSEMYGATGYIRINLATSREILTEALQHLLRMSNHI